MKYGDTLQQRSIPLWETYNVDYNDIKQLIKVRTTQGQGQGKTIPGSNNEAKQLQEFEEEIYSELREQHQRVDLFVQCKAGEIGRRLSHLDKQIAQLKIRTFASGQSRISIRRLEKFSKVEEATLKAGEEIQSLSRFIGAQRLAFQKLLKKYRKWTGSPDLGQRFREGVLERPLSFLKRDLQPLLAQWTEVLASVRAPFNEHADWRPGSPQAEDRVARSNGPDSERFPDCPSTAVNTPSSAEYLHSIWEFGSNVDIDTALAISPLGPGSAEAVYWIHPDDIVQIHVLLLQYTRLPKAANSLSPLDTPPGSRSSRQGSFSANASRPFPRTDEEVGVIVCDDLQHFVQRRNSEPISEDKPGTVPEKAAASIRYSCSGDAVVVVGTTPEDTSKSAQPGMRILPSKAKFKRKIVGHIFGMSKADQLVNGRDAEDSERVYKWLREHQEVQPLVQLQSRRTRFVGLKNSKIGGIWATLDTDVLMSPSSRACVADRAGSPTIIEGGKHGTTSFPHAILAVRIEGDAGTELLSRLDASHLTERVRGFSLETHAVATLCKPHGMSRPFWLPALGQDIRKVPAATKASKRRASQGRFSPEQSTTRHTSISATSAPDGPSGSGFSGLQGESSATSAPDVVGPLPSNAFKKKRTQSHRKQTRSTRQRYWNEFDDGSEGSDNETYTIFVDPNASSSFPGVALMSKLFTALAFKISAAEQKVGHWLILSRDTNDREREPLVNDEHSPIIDDSDLSDVESFSHGAKPGNKRRYATFPVLAQQPAVHARETLLFRSCLASFAASFAFLVVATILKTTGRRKAETTVDAGVIIGVASSLVFAIIAVGSMLGRREDVGWVHRTVVFLIFLCIAVGGGGLIAGLGRI